MDFMDMLKIKVGSYEIRGEILILIGLMTWVIIASVCFSCMRINFGIEEGFDLIKNVVESGTLNGSPIYKPPVSSADLNIYPRTVVSPTNNLATTSSELTTGNDSTLTGANYKPSPEFKPLTMKDGELDIMAASSFSPDCCPSYYSNSNGCACMTDTQTNFLTQRGGNNFPVSEY